MTAMYLSTDADAWIYGVVSIDSLMQQYAPGGFWAQHPPQGTSFPCVRWWEQSPGQDVRRQDGQMGLSEAQPKYVITMLDRQPAGQVDKVYGTAGQATQTPFLQLGAKRLGTLFHGRYEPSGGFQWQASIIDAYQMIDPDPQGENDVMVGYFIQLRAQPI